MTTSELKAFTVVFEPAVLVEDYEGACRVGGLRAEAKGAVDTRSPEHQKCHF
jgi:hypothetical protein